MKIWGIQKGRSYLTAHMDARAPWLSLAEGLNGSQAVCCWPSLHCGDFLPMGINRWTLHSLLAPIGRDSTLQGQPASVLLCDGVIAFLCLRATLAKMMPSGVCGQHSRSHHHHPLNT
ncbi:unnamed protein product [Caretta caretta]